MYTDGFVIPIPTNKVDAYRQMAEQASEVWMDYGALDYKECVLEDRADSEHCQGFASGLDLADDMTVIFAWITYKSREHRDEVNEKVMKDPRIAQYCGTNDIPFDSRKMFYSGFAVIVDGLARKPTRAAS